MAGQQEVIAIGGELIEHPPRLGRMQDSDAKIGGWVRSAGHLCVAIKLAVRVVHPGEHDVEAARP